MAAENNRNSRMNERKAGILMPIFSLPSRYGVGSFGAEAYGFVDFLASAGQKLWQVLPLNPTGFGDSPYSSCSVFASNPYFIDLDALIEAGLLKKREVAAVDFGSDKARVDYGKLYNGRFGLLRLAFEHAKPQTDGNYLDFAKKNAGWLDDYALYMALKNRFSMKPWNMFDDKAVVLRRPAAVKKYTELLKDDIEFYKYVQYLCDAQWKKLKRYANEKGILIVGDLPIYCAPDSADVFAERKLFRLDKFGGAEFVAGVPPDAFNEDGQLWGNPLYDWQRMKKDGFLWWMRRLERAGEMFDVVRIDHFRALEGYWAVPAGDDTARYGHWEKGPGIDFINAVKNRFPSLDFIVEDLGYLTEDVHALRRASGFPGMKILEFAFDPSGTSDYLPYKYEKNCVCYTGTHDNSPLGLQLETVSPEERAFIRRYTGAASDKNGALVAAILRAGLASGANTFISQMQDWLPKKEGQRVNTPGTSENNWQWRITKAELTDKLAQKIRNLTELYGR